MTNAEELAAFAVRADFKDLSSKAAEQLKIRLLGSLGCAIAALDQAPTALISDHIQAFCPQGRCTVIGAQQCHIKNHHPDVNLFVDHSQIVQLECLQSGIWEIVDRWRGLSATRRPEPAAALQTIFREV